jgi:hypothetical protein
MEHPLIGDIGNLSIEELSDRINDLYKKLGMVQRVGNGQVANQIRMALETYQNQYRKKTEEASKSNQGTDYSDRIDIS